MDQLHWTKDLFGTSMEIRRGEELIGSIRWENVLNSRAQAMINGRLFILSRDFLLSKLEIYDSNDQSLLGMIMTNLFNPHCDVVINGKRFELEIQNFWQSRWSWKFNGMEMITYFSGDLLSKSKGKIMLFTTLNEETEILLLLGLFVRNQFVFFILLLLLIIILIVF
jgi:hypothetical protein